MGFASNGRAGVWEGSSPPSPCAGSLTGPAERHDAVPEGASVSPPNSLANCAPPVGA
jgi:hypothetical protein